MGGNQIPNLEWRVKMLSDAQKNQFETKGYLVIENLIDATALAAIRCEYG